MSGHEPIWFIPAALVTVVLLMKLGASIAEAEDPSLAELEEEMRTMQIEGEIDKGVVTEVVPERRAKRRSEYENGISVHVRIPNNRGTTTEFWLPIPDELNGRSKIEKFNYLYDIPLDDLDELVGLKVPVEKNRNDEWEVTWEKEWREEFGFFAELRTGLFGTDPRDEDDAVNLRALDKE